MLFYLLFIFDRKGIAKKFTVFVFKYNFWRRFGYVFVSVFFIHYAKVTNKIEIMAKPTPIQFLKDSFSLKRTKPINDVNITMATLFIVKMVELSNVSCCKALSK